MVVADLRPRPNNAINERFRTHPQSPIGYAFSTVLADLVQLDYCVADLRDIGGWTVSDTKEPKGEKTSGQSHSELETG